MIADLHEGQYQTSQLTPPLDRNLRPHSGQERRFSTLDYCFISASLVGSGISSQERMVSTVGWSGPL